MRSPLRPAVLLAGALLAVVPSDGEPVTGAEPGVRLGTLPGVIATLLGGVYLAAGARGGV